MNATEAMAALDALGVSFETTEDHGIVTINIDSQALHAVA